MPGLSTQAAFYGPPTLWEKQQKFTEGFTVFCSLLPAQRKLIENNMNVNDAFRVWKLEGVINTLYIVY